MTSASGRINITSNMTWVRVICILAISSGALAKFLPLPSYITACSRHEPDMSACALKNGRAVLPHIMEGDKRYKVPKLDPVEISYLHVTEGVLGLNMTATQVKVHGLRGTVLEDLEADLKTRHCKYVLFMPRVEIACQYEIEGRILILPITGKGPGNITLSDVRMNFTYDWDQPRRGPNNTEYARIKNSDLQFNTSRLYVRLENLFNGNKLLGDQMNVFMDENWRDLVQDIGPIIGEAIGVTMRSILQNIFDLVSYDDAFPDTPPAS